ncbi:hypothetical protein HYX16_02310 [Candidatus Woesearchaeota archaeon]|nr:hypothetical protein [Candidatus Woesearchaeota archaeon]
MKLKFLVLAFILFSISLVYANTLDLRLNKNLYVPQTSLKGSVLLNISESLNIGFDPKITLSINGKEEIKDLIPVLESLDSLLDIKKSEIRAVNPENEKSLDSGSGFFAFKLRKDSVVNDINFDIEGLSSGAFPYAPFLDFDSNGIFEWFFGGTFRGWTMESSAPLGLVSERAGEEIFVDNNIYLHCSVIDLPLANMFNISVLLNTHKVEGSISASIFDFDELNIVASNKKGECLLQNSFGERKTSCVLNTQEPLSGNHLVCFYNKENRGEHSLPVDNNGGQSTFLCDSVILSSDETQCTKITEGDLYIKVFKPDFFSQFSIKTKLSDFSSVNNIKNIMTNHLSQCTSDENNECALVVKIGSENEKGILKISSLNLKYQKPNGLTAVSNKFFDVDKTDAEISGRSGLDFVNYSLTIPLEIFNSSVPEVSDDFVSMDVKVDLAGLSDKEKITVTTSLVPVTEALIDDASLSFDNFNIDLDIKEFISVSGINLGSAVLDLNNFKTELTNIKLLNLSAEGESARIESLKKQVEIYLQNLPKKISVEEKISYPRIYPTSINREILGSGDETQLLALQDSVSIENEVKLFKIKDYSGNIKEKTLIKRTLFSSLPEYFIVEEIPKDVLSSASSIATQDSSFSIVNEDPVLKWKFTGSGEIKYIIDGNVLDKLNQIVTTVVAETDVEKPLAVCGDGVCTSILEDKFICPSDCKAKYNVSWPIIVLLVVLLLVGVLYFNFVMGKRKLKDIFPDLFNFIKSIIKETPRFASAEDERNLRNYVLKALNKKIPKQKIYEILLKKKWKNDQIDYIFKQIKK